MFETASQFFFKPCITLQCHDRQLFCTFLAGTIHDLDKRSQSKCKILDFWLLTLEFNQIYFLIRFFFWKCIKFRLKKCRGVMSHDTEEWSKIWRKTDLWFGKSHEEFFKFPPEHLKVWKLTILDLLWMKDKLCCDKVSSICFIFDLKRLSDFEFLISKGMFAKLKKPYRRLYKYHTS